MKQKLIFGVIAVLGAFLIYLLKENEVLAGSFVLLVWGVYEKFTKEEIKKDFKETNNITYKSWKETRLK